MNRVFLIVVLAVTLALSGCSSKMGDYSAASSISRNGFARDASAARQLEGQTVKLWGFVDHGNLYGDDGAKQILGDWWSGEGPTPTSWRFNLKADQNDEVGRSFEVRVPNDAGRDDLLRAFVADAEAQRPTRVFLTGTLTTFDAPTNAGLLTGLRMELQSADNIKLALPEDNR